MQSSGRQVFAKYFMSTLVLLTAVFAAFILLVKPGTPRVNVGAAVPDQTAGFIPARSENMTALLMFWENGDEPAPANFVLMGFYPIKDTLPVLVLPAETDIVIGGEHTTLARLYTDCGPAQTAREMAAALGIKIDRYAGLDRRGFSDIADLFGEFEYNVTRPVFLESSGFGVTINPGPVLIGGRRMTDMCYYDGYDGGELERATEFAKLLTEFLNANSTAVFAENIDRRAEQILGTVQGNISFNDYAYRLPGARYLAEPTKTSALDINEKFRLAGLSPGCTGEQIEIISRYFENE